MDNNEVANLLTQVRTAHRLLAAYYQRLFPQVQQLCEELRMEFYYWGNSEFGLTPKGHSSPLGKSAYALLPGQNPFFYFRTPPKDKASKHLLKKGEFLVTFDIYNDDAFVDYPDADPNPLEIEPAVEAAGSTIQVGLCYMNGKKEANIWEDIVELLEWPDLSIKPKPVTLDGNEECLVTAFQYSIDDFIQDSGTEELLKIINKHIEVLSKE